MKSDAPLISYSQNGEDIVLQRALGDIRIGFYVDVGAADPEDDSVTKLFYDRGWSGINIEPNPDFVARLREQRPRDINLASAISSQSASMELNTVLGTGLSTLVRVYAEEHERNGFVIRKDLVQTKTLDSVLEEYLEPNRDIHFLKIDTEGFEASVLHSINLRKYRPWIILYEATKPNTNIIVENSADTILRQNGYEYSFFDGLNKYFFASEHAERGAQLFPVNCIDNYVRSREAALRRTLTDSMRYNEALRKALDEKDEELARAASAYAALRQAFDDKEEDLRKTTTDYHDLLRTLAEKHPH